jgi:hypothetical protein
MATINIKAILDSMQKERQDKYKSGLGYLSKVVDLFGPDYAKGAEKQALSSVEASLAGRGLGGATMPGALSVGVRQQFEDIRKNRLGDALINIGKYISGGTPAAGTISHLATGGFSGLLGQSQLDFQKSMVNPDWLALQSPTKGYH